MSSTGTARGASLGLPADGPGSPATFGPRLVALVVDSVASVLVAALVLSFTPRDNDLPGVASHLPGTWSLVPLAVDYLVGALLTGQTLGMYFVKLRMVAVDRQPSPSRVRPLQLVIRTVLLFLFVPAVIVDRDGRGLHDRISGTVIVRA
ncbi:RDD family protein [Jatrophihabitans sp. YIM 134969]